MPNELVLFRRECSANWQCRFKVTDVRQRASTKLLFLCDKPNDSEETVDRIFRKTLSLWLFADEHGKMNRSVSGIKGDLLVVSQFTHATNTCSENRPSFSEAAPPCDA
jgi:D-tyrosyl-tRNA(Tyr) deacylase